MGGYLAAAYAERHPDRVHKLVLLSPVGLPRRPGREEEARTVGSLPFVARCAIKTARYLFESRGITPGDFLRSLPASKSRSMVESYVGRRLPALSCPEERAVLGEYLYQNSMLPGSGEYCLGEILTAGAYARMPLVDRIPDLGGGGSMEVHAIYGQRDWMDYRGGIDADGVFVHGVRDAGHLLMLDNCSGFNDAVLAAVGWAGGGGGGGGGGW
jgi:cardiolipin-specific phospholipase